ncbi:hypothetical protein D9M70_473570 [compost metagenome]
MQLDQVVEHALADIRDESLAKPGHQVEAREGADRQGHHQQHEQADGMLQGLRRLGRQALVDQQLDALADGQGDGGGEQQRQQRTEHLPAVRRDEAPGQAQGIALAGGQQAHESSVRG